MFITNSVRYRRVIEVKHRNEECDDVMKLKVRVTDMCSENAKSISEVGNQSEWALMSKLIEDSL